MRQSWIPFKCPACQMVWESALGAVPTIGGEFECPYCQARDSVQAFVNTNEELEILESFQGR